MIATRASPLEETLYSGTSISEYDVFGPKKKQDANGVLSLTNSKSTGSNVCFE